MKKTFILQQQEISFVKNTFTQNLIEQLGIIEVQGPILSEVGNGMQDNLSGIEKAVQVNVKCIPNAVYEVVHSLLNGNAILSHVSILKKVKAYLFT